MSKRQKLYNYECKACGFEKGLPEFLIEEFRQDAIFSFKAIASLEDDIMPVLMGFYNKINEETIIMYNEEQNRKALD